MSRVLLTGATGYVGGRLLPRLEERGYRVRCMARDARRLTSRTSARTEVVEADALDASTLAAALEGIDAAYYLVHSMGDSGDFAAKERQAAWNFGEAAKRAGCRRIVYLGALAHGRDLSPHLSSRQEVGRILAASGVQTIELRASVIIGSGSLALEIIRTLMNRLPVLVTPRWVATPTQPLAIEDALAYPLEAAELGIEENRICEIGAPARVSYGDLLRGMPASAACVAG